MTRASGRAGARPGPGRFDQRKPPPPRVRRSFKMELRHIDCTSWRHKFVSFCLTSKEIKTPSQNSTEFSQYAWGPLTIAIFYFKTIGFLFPEVQIVSLLQVGDSVMTTKQKRRCGRQICLNLFNLIWGKSKQSSLTFTWKSKTYTVNPGTEKNLTRPVDAHSWRWLQVYNSWTPTKHDCFYVYSSFTLLRTDKLYLSPTISKFVFTK